MGSCDICYECIQLRPGKTEITIITQDILINISDRFNRKVTISSK